MPDDALAAIAQLVRPALRGSGVELVDLHWDGRTRPATLRVVIDSDGGVSLDDCERASGAVAAVLDAHDPIADAYLLEVSSPGAERPLRSAEEWRRALGRRVNVRYRSGDAETVVEGTLLAVADGAVEVETRGRRIRPLHPVEVAAGVVPQRPTRVPVRVPLDDVVAGRLAVEV